MTHRSIRKQAAGITSRSIKKPYSAETFQCGQSIGFLLRRAFQLASPRAEALFVDMSLTFSHWIALMALRDEIASTSAQLSRFMNHDPGATSRLVHQLEWRGFLTRKRSRTDRRIIGLCLTRKGIAFANAYIPAMVNLWNGLLDDFSSGEVESLISSLRHLIDRLESSPESTEARNIRA